jgi:hypothetical protein
MKTDHDRALDTACRVHADGHATDIMNLARAYMEFSGDVESLREKVAALEAEKETWGNEFSAVCMMKERVAALEALIKEKDVRLRVIANGSHRLIFKDTSDEAFRREAGALASDALALTPNSIQSRAQARAQAQARVIEAAKEVLWIDECRCDDAWTKRGMHEPNALCGEMKPLRDALAELERT